jgi:hypothetical protein
MKKSNISFFILGFFFLIFFASCKEEEIVAETEISGRVVDKESHLGAEGISIAYTTNRIGGDLLGGSSFPIILGYTDINGYFNVNLVIDAKNAYHLSLRDTTATDGCPKYFVGDLNKEVDRTKKAQKYEFTFSKYSCE